MSDQETPRPKPQDTKDEPLRRDIRLLGAITRITLKVEGQDELIEAEVAKDHVSLDNLARGTTLYFKPKGGKPVSNPAG